MAQEGVPTSTPSTTSATLSLPNPGIPPVVTVAVAPSSASLTSGLSPEAVQQIAGAVAAILHPSPSVPSTTVNPLLSGGSVTSTEGGPSASSRPTDATSGKPNSYPCINSSIFFASKTTRSGIRGALTCVG